METYFHVAVVVQYIYLVVATLLFEIAYVRWVNAAVGNSAIRTAMWGTVVAGLGVVGLRGAIELRYGLGLYLIAVLAGGYYAVKSQTVSATTPTCG